MYTNKNVRIVNDDGITRQKSNDYTDHCYPPWNKYTQRYNIQYYMGKHILMCSTLYNDKYLKSNYVVYNTFISDQIFILTSAIETEIFIRNNVET